MLNMGLESYKGNGVETIEQQGSCLKHFGCLFALRGSGALYSIFSYVNARAVTECYQLHTAATLELFGLIYF